MAQPRRCVYIKNTKKFSVLLVVLNTLLAVVDKIYFWKNFACNFLFIRSKSSSWCLIVHPTKKKKKKKKYRKKQIEKKNPLMKLLNKKNPKQTNPRQVNMPLKSINQLISRNAYKKIILKKHLLKKYKCGRSINAIPLHKPKRVNMPLKSVKQPCIFIIG